ncbi:hypothetical protein [Bosea sp. CRIB-10]|uniref:hypothetical protein n=1 Tax=Bosea sp. CRIB-10 TaxID=378404 RepID=UPI001FCD3593|nr:hypothetical protein [Bosea sp. CRIB-10]
MTGIERLQGSKAARNEAGDRADRRRDVVAEARAGTLLRFGDVLAQGPEQDMDAAAQGRLGDMGSMRLHQRAAGLGEAFAAGEDTGRMPTGSVLVSKVKSHCHTHLSGIMYARQMRAAAVCSRRIGS